MASVMGLAKRKLQRSVQRLGYNVTKTPVIGDMEFSLSGLRRRGFAPRGILDVGANDGSWTRMALGIWPDTPVIMIEPQDEMEKRLQSLCRSSKNLRYVKAGAGSSNGFLYQTIWDDLAGSSFLPKVDDNSVSAGRQRLTRVVTLDEVVAESRDVHVDLVKMDIQGFELEALKGGQRTLSSAECFIIETSLYRFEENMPLVSDIVHYMTAEGFSLYDISGFLHRPFDGALGQLDVVFAKHNGFLRKSSDWG